jgi:hypothetical protein
MALYLKCFVFFFCKIDTTAKKEKWQGLMFQVLTLKITLIIIEKSTTMLKPHQGTI